MDVKLAKGDLAYLDYDVFIVAGGDQRTLHETTRADVAKAENKYEEKRAYSPVPVVVGHDRMPKGLDEALLDAAVGESKEFVVPPEKGAGERDPRLVKLYPVREFHRREIDPAPGMEVTVENRRGTVVAVTAGRVRVDFNNPLAGRTLRYNVTVTKRAESAEEKVRSILDMDYGLAEQFKLFVKETEADVFVPDVCKTDERWFVAKFRVVADLREFAGIAKVRFVEEYEKKVEEKKAEPAPEAAKEGAPAEEKPAEEKPAERRPAAKPGRAKVERKRKAEEKGPRRRATKGAAKEGRAEEELPAEEKQPEEL
jgi:FKBP-type peptidyl-prolyl cis-trans isomerase 2